MRRCVLALLFALNAAAGSDPHGDRLKSIDCQRALDRLQALEAEALAEPAGVARRSAAKEIDARRREAARICLGGAGEPPPPSARYSPPVAHLPMASAPHPAIALPAPPTPPPMTLPAVKAPPIVTSCDASGCWASDGTRLQRLGPDLLGPHGVCTLQGTLLHCP